MVKYRALCDAWEWVGIKSTPQHALWGDGWLALFLLAVFDQPLLASQVTHQYVGCSDLSSIHHQAATVEHHGVPAVLLLLP